MSINNINEIFTAINTTAKNKQFEINRRQRITKKLLSHNEVLKEEYEKLFNNGFMLILLSILFLVPAAFSLGPALNHNSWSIVLFFVSVVLAVLISILADKRNSSAKRKRTLVDKNKEHIQTMYNENEHDLRELKTIVDIVSNPEKVVDITK